MGSHKHPGNCVQRLPKREGSWQMLMLPRVGPGVIQETEHAKAAANTVLS